MKTPRWDAIKREWHNGGIGAPHVLIEQAIGAVLEDLAFLAAPPAQPEPPDDGMRGRYDRFCRDWRTIHSTMADEPGAMEIAFAASEVARYRISLLAPAQPEPKVEPPAPATSVETRWSPDVGSDGRACMVVSRTGAYVAAADLAFATKALRKRAEKAEWERDEAVRRAESENLERVNAELNSAQYHHDLREQRAENDRLKADLAALRANYEANAAGLDKQVSHRQRLMTALELEFKQTVPVGTEPEDVVLRLLRASQPAGLPTIGETVEVWRGPETWEPKKVREYAFAVDGDSTIYYVRGDCWRRQPTDEKEQG